MLNFGEDPSSIKEVMPMCPITIFSINHDTPLAMCPMAHMSKKMSKCQKDSKCQKVKHMDYGEVLQKIKKNKKNKGV